MAGGQGAAGLGGGEAGEVRRTLLEAAYVRVQVAQQTPGNTLHQNWSRSLALVRSEQSCVFHNHEELSFLRRFHPSATTVNTTGDAPQVDYWIVCDETRHTSAMVGHVMPGYPGKM